MLTQARRTVFDVVIIGSQAPAGGITAKVLVEAGLNVAMLEAGPMRDYKTDFPYHDPPCYQDPFRGTQGRPSRTTELAIAICSPKARTSPIRRSTKCLTTGLALAMSAAARCSGADS